MTADIRQRDVAGRQKLIVGCGQVSAIGGNFVLKEASLDFASVCCPEQRGGRFSEDTFTLKSIGAFVFVRLREVVRFWESPLREAPLYNNYVHVHM